MKKNFNNFKKFIIRNKKYIIFTFILLVIAYGIRIFNYDISIDSEVTINDKTANSIPWFATGRWALVIVGKFIHLRMFDPYFSTILTMLFFELSVILFAYLINKITNNDKYDKYTILTIGGIVLTSPVIADMLSFTMMSAEIAIGLTLLAISINYTYNFVFKDDKKESIIAIITLTIAMGIYQAFIPFYISLAIIMYIFTLINKEDYKLKDEILKIIKIIAVFVLSYIAYNLIDKMIVAYLGIGNSEYLSSQIRWGKDANSIIIENLKKFINSIIIPENLYSIWNYGYIILLISSLILSIKLIIKRKIKAILIILALFVLYITPFLLPIIMGNRVVTRAMMNFPIVMASGYLLLITYFYYQTYIRILLIIIITLTSIIQIKTTNDLLYSDLVRFEEDKRLTETIFNKIYDKDIEDIESKKIILIGARKSKSPATSFFDETLGHSFYEWDAAGPIGINQRVFNFAKTMGHNYILCEEKEYKKAQELAKDLKQFPNKDSILIRKDYIIVRI